MEGEARDWMARTVDERALRRWEKASRRAREGMSERGQCWSEDMSGKCGIGAIAAGR